MSVSDPIADMITKIRNASMARNESTDLNYSVINMEILKILKAEGYILNYKKVYVGERTYLRSFLKYDNSKRPVITNIQRVSKPGCRVYAGYRDMPRIQSGLGTLIVTTAKGVLTDRRARRQQVGGELICSVW